MILLTPLYELGFKIFTDCVLHEQPGGGCAALAIDRVDHEDHCIHCPVQISIVKDNHRVFATQFEVIAFQCIGTLLGDQAACPAFTDKGDGLDLGMLTQCLPSTLTKPV